VAVALQYATGGNLVATLETLSEIVRKRRIARLKAKAVSAEVRLSTYILSALPFLVIGALLVVSPDYLKPLIADRTGNWILGGAIGSLLTGLFVMRNMMNSVSTD
jgi:tight adherence protein B